MKTTSGRSAKVVFTNGALAFIFAVVAGSSGCQKEDAIIPSGNRVALPKGSEMTVSDLPSDTRFYKLNKNMKLEDALATVSAKVLPATDALLVNGAGVTAGVDVYNIAKFDHQSGRSHLPDYTVSVRSDGWVVYDGHINVRIKDRIAFRLADITIPVIKEVFEQYSFYLLNPDFDVYPDMPVVYTTYQPGLLIRPRTIYDDCNNNPLKLILIRNTVENLLGIERFTKFNGPEVPVKLIEPSL